MTGYSFWPLQNNTFECWNQLLVRYDLTETEFRGNMIKFYFESYISRPLWDLSEYFDSSEFETNVPEKSRGSFKYVKQNDTMRATIGHFVRKGVDFNNYRGFEEVRGVVAQFNHMNLCNVWITVYKHDDPYTKLLTDFNCFNKDCTDLATSSQAAITHIQNYLSFAIEVFEAMNMSNIGTRYLEKLLRLLRRTVQLKEQFEQLAKMADECFSILGLSFIKGRQEEVTDYPRYPDYLEHC